MTQPDNGGMNPAQLAAQAAQRQAEAALTPEQKAQRLSEAVDELLSRDVSGKEEAHVLELAQHAVNEALGRGE